MTRSPSLIAQFRQKHYDIILDALIRCIMTDDRSTLTPSILYPVAINSTKALNSLLKTQDFKDHLSITKYESILSVVLEALTLLTQSQIGSPKAGSGDAQSITANDSLITELLILFQEFLGPSSTSTLCLFSNSNTTAAIDNYYLRITKIITDYSSNIFTYSRRESETIIVIFRIINRSLIDLATLDIQHCYRLSEIGTRFLLDLKSITFSRLIEEVVVFTNLIPDFICLGPKSPILASDNWNTDDAGRAAENGREMVPAPDSDNSILVSGSEPSSVDASSIHTTSIHTSSSASSSFPATRRLSTFNLIILLYDLLQSQDDRLTLQQEDIQLRVFSKYDDRSWLSSPYFKLCTKQAQASTAWLLRLGMARIMEVYYRMKGGIVASGHAETMSKVGRDSKRRKLSGRIESRQRFYELLQGSESVESFLLNLSTDDESSGLPLLALQSLTLLISRWASTANLELSAHSLGNIIKSLNRFFDTLLSRIDSCQQDVKLWSFICLRVLVCVAAEFKVEGVFISVSSRNLNRAFKYALELIKDPYLCRASCSLISALWELSSLPEVDFHLEKSVLQQYETVVDLSEISGPALVCKQSVVFWVESLTVCTNYQFRNVRLRNGGVSELDKDSQLFSSKCSGWLLSRINQLGGMADTGDVVASTAFIFWLTGEAVTLRGEMIDGKEDLSTSSTVIAEYSLDYWEKTLLREYVLTQKRSGEKLRNLVKSAPRILPVLAEDSVTSIRLVKEFREFVRNVCVGPMDTLGVAWWICGLGVRYHGEGSGAELSGEPSFSGISLLSAIEEYQSLMAIVDGVNWIPETETDLLRGVAELLEPKMIITRVLSFINDPQFNTGDWAFPDKEDAHVVDDLLIDEGGGPRPRVNQDSAACYNYRSLVLNASPEMRLLRFCMKLITAESDTSDAIRQCMKIVTTLKSELRSLSCYFELETQLQKMDIADLQSGVVDDLLSRPMDFLQKHRTKTYELTVVVLCRLLATFAKTWIRTENVELREDCLEVCNYFKLLHERDMLYTEREVIEFAKLLSTLAANGAGNAADLQPSQILLSCFAKIDNFGKASLTSTIAQFIGMSPSSSQLSIYDNFVGSFIQPQRSIESSATFSYFFSVMSTASDSITLAAVCHLIEFSRYDQVKTYLEYSLQDVCKLNGIPHPAKFFWSYRELIFKCWRGLGLPMQRFPFEILGCYSFSDLIHTYSKELVAIAMAYDDQLAVRQIAKVTGSTEHDLVEDSLSLAIAIAWTKDGIRSKIIQSLGSFMKKGAIHKALNQQLVLIVFEALRFCSCSGENLDEGSKRSLERGGNSGVCTFSTTSSTVDALAEFDLAIPADACFGLISWMLNLYQVENFWTTSTVYFLISRFLFLLERAMLVTERQVCLRRIGVVLSMNLELASNIHIARLVMQVSVKFLGTKGTRKETVRVVTVVMESVSEYNPVAFEQVCTPLLIQLLLTPPDPSLGPIIERIKMHLDKLKGSSSTAETLMIAGLEVLENRPSTLDMKGALSVVLKIDLPEAKDIIHLLSLVLPHTKDWSVTFMQASCLTDPFVQRLYDIYEKYGDVLSYSFKNWIGYCIGQYYSQFGKHPIVHSYEYRESLFQRYNGPEFTEKVKLLDPIFEQMTKSLQNSDLETRICFELIASVVIWKKHESKDLNDLLTYSAIFPYYEEYIYPMNNYLCSLAGSEFDVAEQTYYRGSLEMALKGFDSIVRGAALGSWLPRLYFAIVNELNSRSSIITILTTYICRIPAFAKISFAPLVLFYINAETSRRGKLIVKMISSFFSADFKELTSEAIDLFLELVLLIRIGSKNHSTKFLAIDLELNHRRIFEAALHNSRPKAALMLMEDFYMEADGKGKPIDWKSQEYSFLTKVYTLLDENDLFLGLPAYPTLACGLNYIRHNGKKVGALMFDSAGMESVLQDGESDVSRIACSTAQLSRDMMQMGWSGISSVLGAYGDRSMQAGGVGAKHKDVPLESVYERSWKLGQWDLPALEKVVGENQAIYKALKGIHDSPERRTTVCWSALGDVTEHLNDFVGGVGSGAAVQVKFESWCRTLAFLVNVGQVLELDENTAIAYVNSSEHSLAWIRQAEASASENIILGRKAAYELLPESFGGFARGFGVLNELHRYGSLMRAKGENQKSINAAVQSNRYAERAFAGLGDEVKHAAGCITTFDLSAAFWAQGEETAFPVEALKQLINAGGGSQTQFVISSPKLSSGLLHAYIAKWTNESRQETPANIMRKYVEKEAGNKSNEVAENSLMYRMFAEFCDGELRNGGLDTKIAELGTKSKRLGHDLKELEGYFQKERKDSERKAAKHAFSRLKVQYKSEVAELKTAIESKRNYIAKAIDFYLKAIMLDGDGDCDGEDLSTTNSSIDRFCALWLENSDIKIDPRSMDALPSHLLVTWNNQLSSRLLDEQSSFQKLLRSLLLRIATDHPFHTLYLLKSLCITGDESADPAAQSRGRAAGVLWMLLQSHEDAIRVIGVPHVLHSIDELCDRSVALARFQLKRRAHRARVAQLPDGEWWIGSLPKLGIPSPVADLQVERGKPYDGGKIPVIVGVDSVMSTAASGVSQPKILKLQLSDGSSQKLLLKGGSDDLRQDAIMEQVFEKVNVLLRSDDEARKRGLRIRTYKVVSLGPQSGIMEFVTNSVALYDILKHLHSGDTLRIDQARSMMKEVQGKGKDEKIDVYLEIVSQIPPAFRRFFFNNFVSPDAWYRSRLLYTRGVASTSIIGYVLGLGDRHCNNILIDSASGEPIHIDLGVAFDQGKALPIPETVPFRLTRDIVDGFGITGVQGLFSKSCEQVLRLLRTHSQYICGILDVLKYDPLYSWTLSPLRKKRLQNLHVENEPLDKLFKQDTGSEANLAIEVVKKKLKAEGLTDEAVVRVLIRNATNEQNLAMIYLGWCPFL
ncbi:DEKNAAC100172 [Brettanomyces naardenensis]|uniref:Serine/threonine-protein kinase TEL1 n=1 Tax=Brettanomyces naardenensis TaxID=13370 RepID=A0A448YF70_BRENA|nr:DEKNAAC100172 [Brettanomyces naardenensis]